MIAVGVAGAAGRMGSTVCGAVEAAEGMELTGRADPSLRVELAEILPAADVVVEFSTPDTTLVNAIACLEAGVHVVVGATGAEGRKVIPHRKPALLDLRVVVFLAEDLRTLCHRRPSPICALVVSSSGPRGQPTEAAH